MSYNNYVDADAARRAAFDFAEPCVAIMKHANPCGIALGADLAQAHRPAHECDPASAFGGVIAANGVVDRGHGRAGGRDLHRGAHRARTSIRLPWTSWPRRKNLRVLRCAPPQGSGIESRPVSGGLLMQSTDRVAEPGDDPAGLAAGDRRARPAMRCWLTWPSPGRPAAQ